MDLVVITKHTCPTPEEVAVEALDMLLTGEFERIAGDAREVGFPLHLLTDGAETTRYAFIYCLVKKVKRSLACL